MARGRKREDVTGRTFGYLTVIRMAGSDGNGRSYAECECVCGTIKRVRVSSLKEGRTKSCGCMKGVLVSDAVTKHGDSLPDAQYYALYKAWVSMRHRNHVSDYRDTGIPIGVYDGWRSWLGFKAWALSSGYRPGLFLMRIRKDGPFSPDNCRWVEEGETVYTSDGEIVHR